MTHDFTIFKKTNIYIVKDVQFVFKKNVLNLKKRLSETSGGSTYTRVNYNDDSFTGLGPSREFWKNLNSSDLTKVINKNLRIHYWDNRSFKLSIYNNKLIYKNLFLTIAGLLPFLYKLCDNNQRSQQEYKKLFNYLLKKTRYEFEVFLNELYVEINTNNLNKPLHTEIITIFCKLYNSIDDINNKFKGVINNQGYSVSISESTKMFFFNCSNIDLTIKKTILAVNYNAKKLEKQYLKLDILNVEKFKKIQQKVIIDKIIEKTYLGNFNKMHLKHFGNGNTTFFLSFMSTDPYTITRMFVKWDTRGDKKKRTATKCEIDYNKNIVCYGGYLHTEIYVNFIENFFNSSALVKKPGPDDACRKEKCVHFDKKENFFDLF